MSPPPSNHLERQQHVNPHQAVLDTSNYMVGIGLLFVVVFLWTLSNFITQALFEAGYSKPFFVTYTNTAAFALYLIPHAFDNFWKSTKFIRSTSRHDYFPVATSNQETDDPSSVPPNASKESVPLTSKETRQLAYIFCALWFVANWTINASLQYTNVASCTILSSTSGFLTLLVGRIFKVESFNSIKWLSVTTSFLGVVLVTMSDRESMDKNRTFHPSVNSSALLGDLLALLSALFYALYVTTLKIRIGDESRINMRLFFGYVGATNIVCGLPLLVILHFAGTEPFEWPPTAKAWAVIVMNMFITFSSDFIYVIAMLKTTPLVVTLGLSLTIPFAMLGDWAMGRPPNMQTVFGAFLVLCSFGILGASGTREAADASSAETPVLSNPR